jgi:hypothetical protein
MKKIVLLAIAVLSAISVYSLQASHYESPQIELTQTFSPTYTDTVYICTGKYATKYHATVSCKGLNNCRADVVPVSEKKISKAGRTPCRICW